MEMQDWVDIVEKNPNGQKALAKMIRYGKKDVIDTRTIWNKLAQHFEPKFNVATFNDAKGVCKNCGSADITRNGTCVSGSVKYQTYMCNACMRYAGRHAVSQNGGKLL